MRSQEEFRKAFAAQEASYARLLDIWDMNEGHHNFHYKKTVTSALRRIIGLGVCTGGVWTGNLRALRHVLALRTSEAAEEEICFVFNQLGQYMIRREAMLFGDFTAVEHAGGVSLEPKYPKV